jgi:hypothetical protein
MRWHTQHRDCGHGRGLGQVARPNPRSPMRPVGIAAKTGLHGQAPDMRRGRIGIAWGPGRRAKARARYPGTSAAYNAPMIRNGPNGT